MMAVVGADGGRLGVPGAAPLLQRGRTLRLPPQREALGASWSVGPWVPCSYQVCGRIVALLASWLKWTSEKEPRDGENIICRLSSTALKYNLMLKTT